LTEAKRKTVAEMARRELAKRSLSLFLQYESYGVWKSAKHLDLLCSKLEAVERGELHRLMVFMPPRHGKSEVVSKKFPAWFLGRNPNKEVIISSYSSELAYDFSRIARNTLRQWGPTLWNVDSSRDSGAVGRWGIEGTRGGMMASGVGGPITGRGAHVAIIDDPVKNWDEARSDTIRSKIFEWYQSTLRTRLAPGGAIVLVMTRWHEDDLAGRLLQMSLSGEGEQWEVISLPAEAEENDALGRKAGDVLWPERFSLKEYRSMKKAVGSQVWGALYQQHPSPSEGGMLKRGWWKFYKALPNDIEEQIQSWDLTFKEAKNNDYVVGQVWGRRGADRYLIDQVRARMNFPDALNAVRSLTAKHPKTFTKLVEDKANGPALISTLKREISGLIPVEPLGSKEARVSAVSPQIEAGNVYLPDPSIAPWVHDFIEECAAFPTGAHDDQVDGMSQALLRFSRGGGWLAWLEGEMEDEGDEQAHADGLDPQVRM